MSTLVSYLAAVGRPEGAARLVWAGHEPRQFVNLFPEWTAREDVKIFNAKVSWINSSVADRIWNFSIPDPNFSVPEPGSATKNLSILPQKIVF
jgi:hypothetical protein